MTKSPRKEIMLRSRLRNKFLKTKTEKSKQLYNKQQSLCVNLLFLEKAYQTKSITIISKDTEETITIGEELAETFNSISVL